MFFFKSSIVFNFDFVLNFIQESILIKEKKKTSSFNVYPNFMDIQSIQAIRSCTFRLFNILIHLEKL
jgi:hypothetical protein